MCHGIMTLLTYLVELKMAQSPKRFRHQQTINNATQYIRENYNKPLDIDQLAQQAKLSKYYFIKLFKEFMHVAPYEYVINYRINEAKKYLRMTQRKVSQVSDSVGFNDECNFIRTFKRVTGLTPLQYRDRER
jgi:AraC-like DNA-binding protein